MCVHVCVLKYTCVYLYIPVYTCITHTFNLPVTTLAHLVTRI